MTQEYLNFLKSERFQTICNYSEDEIANMKYGFFDMIFPLTYNKSGHDTFIINIRELRMSPDFEYSKECMLKSLEIFLNFFRIKEEGVEKNFLRILTKEVDMTIRIVKSLIYHGLYINANLFAFRLTKFRLVFRDFEDVDSIWQREMLQAIREVEDAGFSYLEPSIFKKY